MEPTTEEIMTTYPKLLCKCGRLVRVHPETGKPQKHRTGKSQPMTKAKRRATWCPEVAD